MSVALMERRTSERLLLACWLAILARIFLIVGLVTTPVAIISHEIWELLYVLSLGIFLLVMGAYTGLAFVLRCPNCGRRVLIESKEPKHSGARKAHQLDCWGTVVWNVVRHQEFSCMHCGMIYRPR
jgi:predicted RNA-binding Zn-ribbon protein involved in translation (DUF1610 family)